MKYISTRGECPPQNFEQVVLTGLAPDGGLFVPQTLPHFSADEISRWRELPYPELALEIIKPFIVGTGAAATAEAGATAGAGTIGEADLRKILADSYASFAHPEVTPLTPLAPSGGRHHLLELFHGPTLAFKDIALQVLGRLLDHILTRRNERVVILGATSGDTGSAALEGCRHSDQVDIVILHPHDRVSEVQRRQMTTVPGNNVLNLAVQGNFDDCQRIVKAAFNDQSFLPPERRLVAVNSINWARIVLQIVYYFAAALKLGGPQQPVSFSVPTGNFGDIYAGYLAKKMGLPINRLIVATNKNDILHRFISNNDYSTANINHTFSPSMDILVSSNFERYLFDLFERDSKALADFMRRSTNEPLNVSATQWKTMREIFDSASVDDDTTCETIAEEFNNSGVLLDPHSAVGVRAARLYEQNSNDKDKGDKGKEPIVTLATAHPAKFSEAIIAAGLDAPALPAHMADLFKRKERFHIVPNDLTQVSNHITEHLRGTSKA
ncbi:MAG: threonine synthase [Pseudohongiellaceae bacterium]